MKKISILFCVVLVFASLRFPSVIVNATGTQEDSRVLMNFDEGNDVLKTYGIMNSDGSIGTGASGTISTDHSVSGKAIKLSYSSWDNTYLTFFNNSTDERLTNWAGANYVQIWVKNSSSYLTYFRWIALNSVVATATNIPYAYAKQTGQTTWEPLTISEDPSAGISVIIPANFEGYLRFDISKYAFLNNITNLLYVVGFGETGGAHGDVFIDELSLVGSKLVNVEKERSLTNYDESSDTLKSYGLIDTNGLIGIGDGTRLITNESSLTGNALKLQYSGWGNTWLSWSNLSSNQGMSNWNGAEYIQLWVKNSSSYLSYLRWLNINGVMMTVSDVTKAYSQQAGQNGWYDLSVDTISNGINVTIPAGYEGLVRIKIPTSINYSNASSFGITAAFGEVGGATGTVYIDDIKLIGVGLVDTSGIMPNPETKNTLISFDESTGTLQSYGSIDSNGVIGSGDGTRSILQEGTLTSKALKIQYSNWGNTYFSVTNTTGNANLQNWSGAQYLQLWMDNSTSYEAYFRGFYINGIAVEVSDATEVFRRSDTSSVWSSLSVISSGGSISATVPAGFKGKVRVKLPSDISLSSINSFNFTIAFGETPSAIGSVYVDDLSLVTISNVNPISKRELTNFNEGSDILKSYNLMNSSGVVGTGDGTRSILSENSFTDMGLKIQYSNWGNTYLDWSNLSSKVYMSDWTGAEYLQGWFKNDSTHLAYIRWIRFNGVNQTTSDISQAYSRNMQQDNWSALSVYSIDDGIAVTIPAGFEGQIKFKLPTALNLSSISSFGMTVAFGEAGGYTGTVYVDDICIAGEDFKYITNNTQSYEKDRPLTIFDENSDTLKSYNLMDTNGVIGIGDGTRTISKQSPLTSKALKIQYSNWGNTWLDWSNLSAKPNMSNWTGAEYLQGWFKNDSTHLAYIRWIRFNGVNQTTSDISQAYIRNSQQNNWSELSVDYIQNGIAVTIPAGFEGLIRFKLPTALNLSSISSFGMTVALGEVGGSTGTVYVDDITIVGTNLIPYEIYEQYNSNNPQGPVFTSIQKDQQRVDGQLIYNEIKDAAKNGDASYTIAPGDYRFTQSSYFILNDILRSADNPFLIKATGVTFWSDLNQLPWPHVNNIIELNNCSNIIFDGLIIDSDPRNCSDGKVVGIDYVNNRIEFMPFAGTFPVSSISTTRIIPFKANGDYISSTYDIDGGQINNNFVNITSTGNGTYWLNFTDSAFLNAMNDPNWNAKYGSSGTLEVNDLISLTYGVAYAFNFSFCKQITVKNTSIYVADGRISEDGYGDNKWINVKCIPRPGTNNLIGGCDNFSSRLKKGSIYYGFVVNRSFDDPMNIMSNWGFVTNVDGKYLTLENNNMLQMKKGDLAIVCSIKSGEPLKTLTIDNISAKTLRFTEDVEYNANDIMLTFPDWSCEGWVVRNSYFLNCYQRLLFQTGKGLFENNYVVGMGSQILIASNTNTRGEYGNEGGDVSNMTVRNNVIVDTAISPKYNTINTSNITSNVPGKTIKNSVYENNLMLNSGAQSLEFRNMRNLTVSNNILINPFKSNLSNYAASLWQSILLNNVSNSAVTDNELYENIQRTVVNADTNNKVVGYLGCTSISQSQNGYHYGSANSIELRVRDLMNGFMKEPVDLINQIRSEYVSVNGVSLDYSSILIGKGVAKQLNATFSPPNAINNNATWSSNNTAVATVSTTGLVTAVSVGTATITVTTEDGDFTAICDVTVKRYDPNRYYKITYYGGSTLAMDATTTGLNGVVKNITYSGANSQQWQIIETTDASTFKIVNRAAGYALKVNSTTNTTNKQLIQTTFLSANNMNFTINDDTTYVQILSKLGSNTYIKSTGATGGTLVTNATNTTTRWVITLLPFREQGDVNQDGEINILDLTSIKQHLLKINVLQEPEKSLADVDLSGNVTISDLLAVKKHILNITY